MQSMFAYAYSFNQPIGKWNVRKVVVFEDMFFSADKFNQDISDWKLKKTCETTDMFLCCPIKIEY
jgi:hypothetical protein